MTTPLFRLFRIQNAAIAGASVAVAALFAPTGFWGILSGAVSMAFLAMAGNIQNDLLDLEIDRTAHPDRPLITGEITPGEAKVWLGGFTIIGVFFAFMYSGWHGLLSLLITLWLCAYNYRLSSMPLVGNISVAAFCTAPLIYLEWPGFPSHSWHLAFFAFITTLVRELLKDLEDKIADHEGGRATLATTHPQRAKKFVTTLLAITVLMLPVPIFSSNIGWPYLPVVLLSCIYCIARIHAFMIIEEPNWRGAQAWSKKLMLAGLISFIVGALTS